MTLAQSNGDAATEQGKTVWPVVGMAKAPLERSLTDAVVMVKKVEEEATEEGR